MKPSLSGDGELVALLLSTQATGVLGLAAPYEA
jgi:hypothetical protein